MAVGLSRRFLVSRIPVVSQWEGSMLLYQPLCGLTFGGVIVIEEEQIRDRFRVKHKRRRSYRQWVVRSMTYLLSNRCVKIE